MFRITFFCLFAGIATLAHAFETSGFTNPYGVAVDPAGTFLYVTNVVGDPEKKDANGFISRLKSSGEIDTLRFIDGNAPGVVLHAPKGIAVAGSTIFVADIDRLRLFDRQTGAAQGEVDFGKLPVRHLYDLTDGPDGALYVTDGATHAVYRVDVEKKTARVFLSSDLLNHPRGIVWFAPQQVFVVASWGEGKLFAFDASGKQQYFPNISVATPQALMVDRFSYLYLASSSLGSVYRVGERFALERFKAGLAHPTDMVLGVTGDLIVVSYDGNRVVSFPIKILKK